MDHIAGEVCVERAGMSLLKKSVQHITSVVMFSFLKVIKQSQ